MASKDSLAYKRQKAQELLKDIQLDYDLVKKTMDDLASMLLKLKGYKENEKDVSDAKDVILLTLESVKKNKTELEALLEEANKNHSEISSFYTDVFLPLKEEIEDDENGAQAFIDVYEGKWSDLVKKQDEVAKLHSSAKKLKEEYETYLENINELEEKYDEITNRIYDEETGIEMVESHIRGVKSQVDDLYAKIEKNKRETDTTKSNIDTLETDAKKKLLEIGKVNDAASVLKDKIEETYGIATVNGQGGYFDKTKIELTEYRDKWMIYLLIIILSTVVVAVSITWLFSDFEIKFSENITANLIIRYSLLSPLIYGIFFCGKQFKIARLSVEQYTYKTVVSFSLENEILFLQDKFGAKDPKIIDFALSNLEKLYSEPFHGDQKEFDNKIALLNAKNKAKKEQVEAKSRFDLIKHGFIQAGTNGKSESAKVDSENDDLI